MSNSGKEEAAPKFEEKGAAGFAFTRKKSRLRNERRKSLAHRPGLLSEVVREREDLGQHGASEGARKVPIAVPDLAAISQISLPADKSAVTAKEIGEYRAEIPEMRALLESTRAQISEWNSAVQQHEEAAVDSNRQLEAAQAEHASALPHAEITRRLSGDRQKQLSNFADNSHIVREVEERHQRLGLLSEQLTKWNQLCSNLAEHSTNVAKQHRKQIAGLTKPDKTLRTPVNVAVLTASSATPGAKVTRRATRFQRGKT